LRKDIPAVPAHRHDFELIAWILGFQVLDKTSYFVLVGVGLHIFVALDV
jgi:hypothetical protein